MASDEYLALFGCGALVLAVLGGVCLYYGFKCMDAELRAEHDHVCKDIHNDDPAKTLLAFGWIFVAPFIIALVGVTFYGVCAAVFS